ncbi:transposase, partial [uncultured Microscilla sp.]|uniref:transposase n=1 Tax=uncultured Microscilla sp. TaxID=432653 RepID=UPI0026054223
MRENNDNSMPLFHLESSKFAAVKDCLLSLDPISYAQKVGLIFRKPKKIIVSNLLLSYWLVLSRRKFSYRCWATELSLLQEQNVEADSIRRYMTPEMLTFVQGLLHKSLATRCTTFIKSKGFETFPAVYVQDATHFRLPKHLSVAFPGSGGKGKDSATAKIQAVFSLKQGQFADFQLGSFRNNDQGDALRFVEHLNEGDLLIRDLGYFKLGAFHEISQKGAYFLSRYRHGVVVTDAKTKKRIPLLKTLKKKQFIDMDVILGTQDSVKCRLIAVPVPPDVAQKRRENAAKDRHKDTNHSEEYMKL